MFFLSDDERRLVFRRLLAQARQSPVAEELRGWSWSQPPLAPVYDVRLAVYEVAGGYCATGRDVYLRRVKGRKAAPNRLMVEGSLLHRVVAELIVRAKRAIYTEGGDLFERLAALRAPAVEIPDGLGGSGQAPIRSQRESVSGQAPIRSQRESVSGQERDDTRRRVEILWDFEYHRIVSRVRDVLSRHSYIGPDALAALSLPVTVEQKLDGSFLGLSSQLSADAFVFSEPMLMDLKFGDKRDFHRLAVAAYALVMESLHEYPVDLGCVTYPKFKGGRVVLERDFFVIDDELRQWFIDVRDEKARMVSEEIDPGKPDECYAECVFRGICGG